MLIVTRPEIFMFFVLTPKMVDDQRAFGNKKLLTAYNA